MPLSLLYTLTTFWHYFLLMICEITKFAIMFFRPFIRKLLFHPSTLLSSSQGQKKFNVSTEIASTRKIELKSSSVTDVGAHCPPNAGPIMYQWLKNPTPSPPRLVGLLPKCCQTLFAPENKKIQIHIYVGRSSAEGVVVFASFS